MLVWVTFCVVKKNWGKHKNKDSYTVQCGVEGIGACLCEDTDCLCGCVCVCVCVCGRWWMGLLGILQGGMQRKTAHPNY